MDDEAHVELVPNPTTGFISIRNAPASVQHITVMNTLGATVQQIDYPHTENLQLDLSKLSAGTYYVRFATGSSVVTKKVVKE